MKGKKQGKEGKKGRKGKDGKKEKEETDIILYPEKSFKSEWRDFPGSPVVKNSPSTAGGAGSISCWGAKIPHALKPKPKHKTEAIL